VFLACVVLLLLIALSCSPTPNTISADTPSNTAVSPAPESTPTKTGDADLASVLDPLLDSAEFKMGRWGVAVLSLRDGKLIYQRNGNELFTPASNMKVYTTAVALDFLGADYHWRTSVYSDSAPDANGTINGDVVLYGRGAPDLVAANKNENFNSLEELASALAKRGVKRVRGNVIGDESYFRGEPIGEGWQWNDLQWYFGAEASALTINGNSADISITSPAKLGDKPTITSSDVDGYIQITNNIATIERGGKFKIGVQRGLSDNNVVVWGEFPLGARGYGVNLSVHRPALWAAQLFIRALKAQGITVDGVPKARDSKTPETERFKTDGKQELAAVISKSLGEIVRVTNKLSVNLYAELILRTLGRERGSMLSSQELPGRERGDEEAGTDIVRLWLSRSGIKTNGLAIHDGSGLSRLNLVTPQATVRLLEAIRRTYSGEIFTDSLPIAAKDGTLVGRLQPVSERVFAKTGALIYDNSLSGYLKTSTGQLLVFSVFCNDFDSHGGATRLIDRLVVTMCDYPNPPSSSPKASAANGKP
jgi:serine-type D-Ala-D-Ala carboxypeptidase/endopeptidase (penicillin-binding protein 4)